MYIHMHVNMKETSHYRYLLSVNMYRTKSIFTFHLHFKIVYYQSSLSLTYTYICRYANAYCINIKLKKFSTNGAISKSVQAPWKMYTK